MRRVRSEDNACVGSSVTPSEGCKDVDLQTWYQSWASSFHTQPVSDGKCDGSLKQAGASPTSLLSDFISSDEQAPIVVSTTAPVGGIEEIWYVKNTFIELYVADENPGEIMTRARSENDACVGLSVSSSEVFPTVGLNTCYQLGDSFFRPTCDGKQAGSLPISSDEVVVSTPAPEGGGRAATCQCTRNGRIKPCGYPISSDEVLVSTPAPEGGGHAATCRCTKNGRIKPCGYFFKRGECSKGENCKFCHHSKHCQNKKARPTQNTRKDIFNVLGDLPDDVHMAAQRYRELVDSHPNDESWILSKLSDWRADSALILKLAKKLKQAQNILRSDKKTMGESNDHLPFDIPQEVKPAPEHANHSNQKGKDTQVSLYIMIKTIVCFKRAVCRVTGSSEPL